MRTELIEDDDGAPYPPCRNCPDQVAPPGTGTAHLEDVLMSYWCSEPGCTRMITALNRPGEIEIRGKECGWTIEDRTQWCPNHG